MGHITIEITPCQCHFGINYNGKAPMIICIYYFGNCPVLLLYLHKNHRKFNANSNYLLFQQPPVPWGWGYHDRVNLTTEIYYKLNYTLQITVHDTKYNNMYIHTRTQKRTYMNTTLFVTGAYLRQEEYSNQKFGSIICFSHVMTRHRVISLWIMTLKKLQRNFIHITYILVRSYINRMMWKFTVWFKILREITCHRQFPKVP